MPIRLKIIRSEKTEKSETKQVEEKKTIEKDPINITEETQSPPPNIQSKKPHSSTKPVARNRNFNSQLLVGSKISDPRRRNPIIGMRI